MDIIPTVNPVFAERLAYRKQSRFQQVWDLLDKVYDPELPGLTIWDLGILQDVKKLDNGWQIDITPTYSGCPAVDAINQDVVEVLSNAGFIGVKVKVVLAPAWSTEMVSPAGKKHLRSINIAPPDENDNVDCPVCGSSHTKLVSQFGSTACKALYQCDDCFENFDYFKHF
ncbi:phenylacetate-CoA oxygenase subunit PaaJ [Aliikangiella coralliicola]|uniref:Phenylacetate-CoA oxygenase subunit PaaJ n=2 Tax=Aliikangiella coralliicola TaxID=2592383 RepID=A0A545TSR4_9GAMM|nr:phenylacetate-CoA oxygenase subunit PaaJ [Aliikangiella coralliicola]